MIHIKRIVCPVDLFPTSLRAFDYALKIAHDNGAKIYAVHVVSAALPAAYDFPVDISKVVASMEKESKAQMLRLKKKAEDAGVVAQTEVRVGSIDTEILAAIKKFKADLVVMGTHGRHGIERWFMGSVAERMARRCPAPLLTIPPTRRKAA
jgi:nucleotide-binding universal stress UspA family protein